MPAPRRTSGSAGRALVSAQSLHASALFAGLPPPLLARLAGLARVAVLERGEVLWVEGAAPTHVALVLGGRLKATRVRGRRRLILDIALPGDVLGDLAFALREPQATEVAALRRSRVLLVPARALRAVFERQPSALFFALFSLGRRAQRLMRLVDALSAGSVARRLAAALVYLGERAGEPFPGGVMVSLRLARRDLAALAATTAESVSRHLAAWQREGVVTVQPLGYLIRDTAALRLIAAGGSPGHSPPGAA